MEATEVATTVGTEEDITVVTAVVTAVAITAEEVITADTEVTEEDITTTDKFPKISPVRWRYVARL
jgi:hypothetical protein